MSFIFMYSPRLNVNIFSLFSGQSVSKFGSMSGLSVTSSQMELLQSLTSQSYPDRYLCQLVSEPQVHRCASAECDESSGGICLGTWVPQRVALCSVEMRSLDGRQHHLRLTGLRGRGEHVGLGSGNNTAAGCPWCESRAQLKVQLSLLLQQMLFVFVR